MDAERARTILLALPHVVETSQWGGVVFWVGDKAIGGRMFAMMNPESTGAPMQHPLTWPVGQERYAEMLEMEGVCPAPYLARIFWVSAERWNVMRDAEWSQQFEAAHALVMGKLPVRVQQSLALPKRQLHRLVAERRIALAAKAAAKKR